MSPQSLHTFDFSTFLVGGGVEGRFTRLGCPVGPGVQMARVIAVIHRQAFEFLKLDVFRDGLLRYVLLRQMKTMPVSRTDIGYIFWLCPVLVSNM